MANKTLCIDVTKCTGCRGCQVACKQWNQLDAEILPFNGSYQTHEGTGPQTFTIVSMNEREVNGKMDWLFAKKQCMHCIDAPCVKVCPTKALSYSEFGAVTRDLSKCIGCKYCVAACPFGIPKYRKDLDKVTKCSLCSERVAEGLTTACAKTCVTGAIQFGDRDELLAAAEARVQELQKTNPDAQVYGKTEVGSGTNVIYVLGDKPEAYGFPKDAKAPAHIGVWQNAIQPYAGWLVAAAAAGAFVSFFTTRIFKAGQATHAEGGKSHDH